MLPLASLLNPVKSELRAAPLPLYPLLLPCTNSSTNVSPLLSTQASSKKQKMTKDGAVFAKGKIKGDLVYAPFENLDEEAMREVRKFQVYPMGNIEEYCRHIPYNSEKKSFLERTGRESFEVFQYIFKVPGDDKDYTVMWDYNVGLVRITPFFKCCKYSKTTPAKMLNMNPGLKFITHSITGGALAAQGYWMPYSCALAVCTTFCANIAGALIPIFGPNFPSECVPPEAPEFGRMIIDSSIIANATAEAEAYRLQYSSFLPQSNRDSYSPHSFSSLQPANLERNYDSLQTHSTPRTRGRRLRLKRTFDGDSPYGTPTDTDVDAGGSDISSVDGYFCSPVTPASTSSLSQPQGWRPHNVAPNNSTSAINMSQKKITADPNPWLSAIPRSVILDDVNTGRTWGAKRRAMADNDVSCEAEEKASLTDEKGNMDNKRGEWEVDMDDIGANCDEGVEKKAALLLMKLSVKDGESGGAIADATREQYHSESPRVKRRRATSL